MIDLREVALENIKGVLENKQNVFQVEDGVDDSAFVKSIGSSDNSISCSKSGTHVNLTTDAIRHLVIAPNLIGLITKSTSGDTITLSLTQPPGLGMYVLTCQNGSAQWVEVGTCDDSSSSSSSSSEEPVEE